MTSSINLSTLPNDIIRRIIEEDEESAKRLRLICRSWNQAVLVHFSSGKHRIIAERVSLSAGIPGVAPFAINGIDRREIETEGKEQVHMSAVIEERHARRIVAGKWLYISQRLEGGALEVKCRAQRIDATSWTKVKQAFPITCFLATMLCFVLFPYIWYLRARERGEGKWQDFKDALCYIIFPILIVPCFINKMRQIYWNGVEDRKRRTCFIRFFAKIWRIDILQIENNGHTYIGNLGSALHILPEKMHIARLVVRDDLDTDMQKRVVELCNKHRIGHVLITARDCRLKRFPNFIRSLVSLDVRLDVYNYNDDVGQVTRFFSAPRERFDKMIEALGREQISMRMVTVDDESFSTAGYPDGVKAHIRCMHQADV